MATKTDRPRMLIEQWLPIDQIGAECMRERGASSALPPLYFLHVWWARRPLTVSRAAVLASLLPAYPRPSPSGRGAAGEGDESIRPWPKKFLKRFPTFEAYQAWFLKLIGIQGDPAASRRIIEWAKTKGIKLTPDILGRLPKDWTEGMPHDMSRNIPYGYPRAFTYNPDEEQLATQKSRVRAVARQKAEEFEKQGIRGVDLYISTFGPVLSILSERWPVLTSESDPNTGDPLPLKPGEALDLAREEVVNLRKRGLLLGRTVEFDRVTDWYLMAWDAFRAQEFPADEARQLALALGLDLERDLIREKKLVAKKSASVVLNEPGQRRKRGMVDADAEAYPHLIDAVHTAMMVYDEEGSKACGVFADRQGLRTDSRAKALVQAMMQAIPTTRDKDGKFLRGEMATLDALRLLLWDDLPAPKEEEPPPIDPQMKMAGFEEEGKE